MCNKMYKQKNKFFTLAFTPTSANVLLRFTVNAPDLIYIYRKRWETAKQMLVILQ